MNEKTVYLIDGSATIHRAYHAIRGLSNSKGFPTNAAFGFTRMLMALVRDKAPHWAVMVFDAKGPTFRHEIYDQYKANRPPMDEELALQIPYIKDITRGLNIPMLEMGGYEADDLMGTLAVQARDQGFDVVLVTGDKDFNQLLGDGVTLWDPMRDAVRTRQTILEKTGLEPQKMIDVMALWGDSSDNVPGVKGIGEKTALKLIQDFGSLEGVYEHLSEIKAKKQKENLENDREKAFLSKKLVTIDTRAPVTFKPEDFVLGEPDSEALLKIFRELEFRQFVEEFSGTQDLSEKSYKAVLTEEDLLALRDRLAKSGGFSVDTETTSISAMTARLVGMSLAVKDHEAFYIPVAHGYLGAPDQLPLEKVLEVLGPLLADPAIQKTGQNIKYDWIVLDRHGAKLDGVAFDTMVASYLLNPSLRSHSLDQIALDYLNHKTITYEEVCGSGAKAVTFDKVPLEKAVPYAAEDADVTLMARGKLEPLLEEGGLAGLFKTVEMPLVEVLKNMEETGIRVDTDRLSHLSRQFQDEMDQVEAKIYDLAGERFNIASPKQLGVILFEKLALPTQKKTKKKTGYSTDVSVLTALALQHDLPAQVLRYRTLAKLKSTYADALLGLVHPETGRVHSSFNQNVTATGRLSSSDPNLQNIPIRTPEGMRIREAFIPAEGWTLIGADYSQIELRILAHYAKDPVLLDSFARGEDIHLRTASEVFELAPEFVTEDMRREAKAINFGLIYGMGPYRLSQELGITQKLAKRYMENYFHTYKGVKRFMEEAVETARATRKTTTLLGRIRYLPEISSKDRVQREAAERTAINTPIQGTAADFIKIAMVRLAKELRDRKMKTAMLLTVHDELVFEAPPEELEPAKKLIREVMEGVWELSVPLVINMAEGSNWAQAH